MNTPHLHRKMPPLSLAATLSTPYPNGQEEEIRCTTRQEASEQAIGAGEEESRSALRQSREGQSESSRESRSRDHFDEIFKAPAYRQGCEQEGGNQEADAGEAAPEEGRGGRR
ncbi:MAG: hypothetical protein IPM12_11240 [Flavobacteriales bacterium]|nr:hypothetical protein [Flavobacteriales bacterium]